VAAVPGLRLADGPGMTYSRSANPLSQAEIPSTPAFFLYLAFSWGVTRTWICCVAGFFIGGLPLGRLGLSMINSSLHR
jgi:hypothetical protein